ncbi:MAG TPA: hypothetical protein VES65_11455 [Solirubrobacteraceae bacterium]|nr:hypothetical protein [Solirubrobacteraceae bacterium]
MADNLRRGYQVIDSIEPSLLTEVLAPVIGLVAEASDADVRSAGRDLLDRVNAYAEGLYATIHDDDQALEDDTRARVLTAMNQADSDLALLEKIQANLVETFEQDLEDLVAAIGSATEASVKFIADKAKQIVGFVIPPAVWWALGAALILGAGVYAWRLSR